MTPDVLNPAPGEPYNIVGLSGGKDSACVAALMVAHRAPNFLAVFNDTGHENPLTYEYVAYLKRELNLPLTITKADFTRQMAGKRKWIRENWAGDGISQDRIDGALAALQPTGNPFLDLCKWKGRFPSTKRRFCTEELKERPFLDQLLTPMLKAGHQVNLWTGVRAEESRSRAKLDPVEYVDPGYRHIRPILHWKADQVFASVTAAGLEHNPLYKQGMGRVGCMPCIMCRKAEVREVSNRFPEIIDRLEDWEAEVAISSKQGIPTFFAADRVPLRYAEKHDVHPDVRAAIRISVEWSRTLHGGKDEDPAADEAPMCSSLYGLCE